MKQMIGKMCRKISSVVREVVKAVEEALKPR